MAKKLKITPGPWEVYKDCVLTANPDAAKMLKVGRSVTTRRVCLAEPSRYVSPGENQANLSLMAASPDLLDACKYALQFIEEYDPDLTLHPSLRAKLEAAIAKAESAS